MIAILYYIYDFNFANEFVIRSFNPLPMNIIVGVVPITILQYLIDDEDDC